MVLPGPVWIYLVLYIRSTVGSVAGTPCLVDTGYQPRRESLSICAPVVAVVEAHCLGEISFIIGVDSCSRFACGRIGPFWGGVFGTSSIIKGSGIAMAFIVVDSFTEFPINCYLCGESFRRPRDLSDHERVRHSRGFQCGCGRNYETTYQLRKHSFRKGCFIYTLYSWASRRQARSSSNRNSEIRTGFVLEDVPPPSHHGIGSTGSHVFQEREAEVDPYGGTSVLHARLTRFGSVAISRPGRQQRLLDAGRSDRSRSRSRHREAP